MNSNFLQHWLQNMYYLQRTKKRQLLPSWSSMFSSRFEISLLFSPHFCRFDYFWMSLLKSLLTAKTVFWIAWDTLSCMMTILSFYKFFLLMDSICANVSGWCLFQKSIMSSVLRVFFQLRVACNMCQCFVRISFSFGNARLYVTHNGINCLSWHFCWWRSYFRLSLSSFCSFLHHQIVQ